VPTSQAPAHWSKDFVEHLRTVHFALIAISAGLLVLILSSKTYNPSVAVRQLEEIEELKSVWTQEWITTKWGTATSYSPIPTRTPVTAVDLPQNLAENKDPNSNYCISLSEEREVSGTLHRAQASFIVVLPSPKWFSPRRRLDSKETEPDLTSTPQTLSEFGMWWNSLADGSDHYVAIPAAIVNKAPASYASSDFLTLSETGKASEKASKKAVERVRLELYPSFDGRFEGFVTILTVRNKFKFLSCEQYEVRVNQQGLLRFFPDWHTGTFRASFYDLDEASREYRSLPLDRVSKLLSDENTKGSEVFEAFGMKFPAGQITLWGDILLLSVQLYFLVYLRQLSGNLKPDDAGWDVPWIGMNSSGTSKAMSFMSFAVLPVANAISIGWQGTVRVSISYLDRTDHWFWFHLRAKPWTWHYTVLLDISLLFLAAIASSYLSFLSWKYRPQIAPEPPKPPSCPAQLFE
jgi:hypothetical protein